MRLIWRTADPAAVRSLLRRLPLPATLDVRVVDAGAGSDDRLVAEGLPEPGRSSALPAVGWATVDADRLAADWGVGLHEPVPDDALGAQARLVRDVAPATVLLEPATEGRLAAALARLDEGPVALYLPAPAGAGPAQLLATPFGPASLAQPRRRRGPFVLLVASSAGLPSAP